MDVGEDLRKEGTGCGGDPSCPGTSFNHRWDEDQYTNFKAKIEQYAAWAREALDETDDTKAVKLWQKLFGTDFTLPIAVPAGKAR